MLRIAMTVGGETSFVNESSECGLTLLAFDAQEKLVSVRQAESVYAEEFVQLFRGEDVSLESIVSGMTNHNAHVRSGASSSDWRKMLLAAFRRPQPMGIEIWLEDGRWIRIIAAKTDDGGIVSLHRDITHIKAELLKRRLAKRSQRVGVVFRQPKIDAVKGRREDYHSNS